MEQMREQHTAGHVTPATTYVLVAAGLVALTALTVVASFVDLGPFHVVVALAIATAKAALIVLFFMHARQSPRLTRLTLVVALVMLGILLVGTMDDYVTRDWLRIAGH